MKKQKKILLGAGLLLSAAANVNAAPQVDLGLVIDSSGSISAADFNAIKSAYANVLGTLATDGGIAVAVDNFSSNGQFQVFSNQIIASTFDRQSLVNFINGMVNFAGATALSDAIANTADAMHASAFGASKNVIDVATDGGENDSSRFPGNAGFASLYALTQGINQVNCLGVGAATCNFTAGAGSFALTGVTYTDYQTTLVRKIATETNIPEPGTLFLIASGLIGVLRNRNWLQPLFVRHA